MTWVKICGMTNLEDALTAVDAGADAVGFVFYEKSPRNISVEAAREIVEKLPEGVEKVGVFVDHSAKEVTTIADLASLSAVQVYPLACRAERTGGDVLPAGSHRTFLAIPGGRIVKGESFELSVSRELLSRASALFLDS